MLPYQLQEIHPIMSQNTPARDGMILHFTGDQEFINSHQLGAAKLNTSASPVISPRELTLQMLLLMIEHLVAASA